MRQSEATLQLRGSLTTYFALAFAFTWALLPFAQASRGAALLGLFGPAAAAVIAAAWGGRPQLRGLRGRILEWRVPIRWYVVALLLPLAISALASGLEYLWGAHGPIRPQPITGLTVLVFVLVVGEEIGWRGFALPRLLTRFGPWSASAALGALWALWHLPLFHLAGMPQFGSPFLPYVAYTIALSIILTFLAQHTRGSVIIATLFHGAVNTFGLMNTGASPSQRGWGNAVSYGLGALAIGIAAWTRRIMDTAADPETPPTQAMTSDPVATVRFPITFDGWYRVLSTILGMPASSAYVQVTGEEVAVRMGWAFRARFRRSDVASAAEMDLRPFSRGVHGFAGIWLVNGAGRGILRIALNPPQRAYVMGIPIQLRELMVSVGDPAAVAAALTGPGRAS